MKRVLIIGGCGRIGSQIAQDILAHTEATVTVTGRSAQSGPVVRQRLGPHVQFRSLDLADQNAITQAITAADLVVHTAGPFHYRDGRVLQACIQQGVNYLDVSDERTFTQKALALRPSAQAAGVTAVINTGVFPGISNSLARQGIEALDQADSVQLSYVVGGSGGAGVTVMRTTFIGLQHAFKAWLQGRWQWVKPYTERERLTFPSPYDQVAVYWYDMPEAITLSETFALDSVVTKFGVVPDFYNHATWAMAHGLPTKVLQSSKTVEFLARVSHFMTGISDRFSGTGVAMRCDVRGQISGQAAHHIGYFQHSSTTRAVGAGTGSLAQLVLTGQLERPGVHAVEQILPTDQFIRLLASRQLQVQTELTVATAEGTRSLSP
ncbi:MAG: saccharopine dehydrogenase NADP-binding domain-containing protein [Cyanobacteria bacterium P01_A01_bin.70]